MVKKGMEPLVDPTVESHEVATSPKREPVQIHPDVPCQELWPHLLRATRLGLNGGLLSSSCPALDRPEHLALHHEVDGFEQEWHERS